MTGSNQSSDDGALKPNLLRPDRTLRQLEEWLLYALCVILFTQPQPDPAPSKVLGDPLRQTTRIGQGMCNVGNYHNFGDMAHMAGKCSWQNQMGMDEMKQN